MQSLWDTCFGIFFLIECRPTIIMEKYFRRMPEENEEWKLKIASKNDSMKKNKDGKNKNLKKASQSVELKK